MRIPLPAILIPIITFLLYFLVPGVRQRPWTTARISGAILALGGYLMSCVARMQLGDSFSVRPRAKGLVTRGVYSRIRNPIYVFVDLMIVGLIMALDLPWLLLGVPALMIAQAYQARREAKVLEQKFGQAYRDYRRETWF